MKSKIMFTLIKIFLIIIVGIVLYITVVKQKRQLEIHRQENEELKVRSIEHSPDDKKVAYFQNKFAKDIKKIGDGDYTSLIIEHNGKTKVLFQGDHHISHFKWLNNDQIKLYKGCGSSCLLSYVIDISTGKVEESVEKIFNYE